MPIQALQPEIKIPEERLEGKTITVPLTPDGEISIILPDEDTALEWAVQYPEVAKILRRAVEIALTILPTINQVRAAIEHEKGLVLGKTFGEFTLFLKQGERSTLRRVEEATGLAIDPRFTRRAKKYYWSESYRGGEHAYRLKPVTSRNDEKYDEKAEAGNEQVAQTIRDARRILKPYLDHLVEGGPDEGAAAEVQVILDFPKTSAALKNLKQGKEKEKARLERKIKKLTKKIEALEAACDPLLEASKPFVPGDPKGNEKKREAFSELVDKIGKLERILRIKQAKLERLESELELLATCSLPAGQNGQILAHPEDQPKPVLAAESA